MNITPEEDDAPKLQRMIEWRDDLRAEWSDMVEAMEAEKSVFFEEFEQEGLGSANDLGSDRVIRTGSAPADAESAIDMIVPTDVLIRAKPARNKKKYVDQAEKLTRTGQALLHSWRHRKDQLARIAADMVILRIGIARTMFDDSVWPEAPSNLSDTEDPETETSPREEWEVKNRRQNPIKFERRDPLTTWFRQDNVTGEIFLLVEHYKITVLEAKAAFRDYPKSDALLNWQEPNDKVQVSDIWFGRWRCIVIDDRPIFPDDVEEHGYLEIPYRVAPFRELSFDQPEERYRGCLTNSSSMYPLQSQALGMQLEMLKWNAWRTYVGNTWDGRDLDIIPGQYINIDPRKGESLELLQGETIPPEVLQTTSVIDSYINRNGVSQGPGTAEGTRSGQMIWALEAIRQRRIEAARSNLTRLIAGSLELSLMIIETFLKGEALVLPVPGKDRDGNDMGEVSISAKDIDGYHDPWNISMGLRLDPALIEQAKALQALATNQWMPLEVSYELSGLAPTPQEWTDKLFLQAADRSPFMMEMAILTRVGQFFGEDSWEYQTFKQRLQMEMQQGGPPGGGGDQAGAPPGIPQGGTMQAPSAAGGPMKSMGPTSGARPTGNVRGPRTPGNGSAPVPGGGMQ